MDEKYTKFEDVYGKFLSKINDYEMADMPYDDFEFVLQSFLSNAIGLYFTGQLSGRVESVDFEEEHFGTELTLMEQWMLATAMVYEWLSTKIYREDLMKTSVTDRDYTETSPANQLRSLKMLKDDLELELHKFDVEYSYINFDGLS